MAEVEIEEFGGGVTVEGGRRSGREDRESGGSH